MGFLSTFAQDLIDGEPVEANIAEVQCPTPRVIELDAKREVNEEDIAA